MAQKEILPVLKDKKFQNYDQWKTAESLKPASKSTSADPKTPNKWQGNTNAESVVCSDAYQPMDGSFTIVPKNDDGSFGPVNLGFTFSFCSQSFTQAYINTNGNLSFTGPISDFSASGFPFGTPMVAGFWGDIDNRCVTGNIGFKLVGNALIVNYDEVGFFNTQCYLTNSFQILISNGSSPLVGFGNSIQFRYGSMEFTTGSASGGSGGFGGIPATVGFNSGNGVGYEQIGRFNQNNANYDGPFGANDGIDYLTGQCFSFLPNNPPIANCKNATLNLGAAGFVIVPPASINNGSTDDCSSMTFTATPAILTCADFPTKQVTLRVTDNLGQYSECVSTVTLTGGGTTALICPSNMVRNNNLTLCSAVVNYPNPTQIGGCGSPLLTLESGLPSGSAFPVGTTTNVWKTTTASGQTATCAFNVKVNDIELPEIFCGSSVSTEADLGKCGAEIALYSPTTTDNCGILSLLQISGPVFNGFIPTGNYTIVWQATDFSGNKKTCTQTASVVDNESPKIDCGSELVFPTDPTKCGRKITQLAQPINSDNCSVTSISNNSPVNFGIGTTTVHWMVRDAANNWAACDQLITIEDRESPTLICPANFGVKTDELSCSATISIPNAVAFDNCGIQNLTQDWPFAPNFDLGLTNITYLAVDAAGNESTCTFQITVNPRPEICNNLDDDCDGLYDEAEDWQHSMKIVDKNAPSESNVGLSVALNGDYGIFGTSETVDGLEFSGEVHITHREKAAPNGWVKLAKLKHIPKKDDRFGQSVAISGDLAFVGAPGDDEFGQNAGAVFLFQKSKNDSSIWTQILKIHAPSFCDSRGFGQRIALDSTRLAVVSSFDNCEVEGNGVVYLFEMEQNDPISWNFSQEFGHPNGKIYDGFGASIALDSTSLLIGLAGDDEKNVDAGAVFHVNLKTGVFNKWLPKNGAAGIHFGQSVSISERWAIVGAPNQGEKGKNSGAIYFFYLNNSGNWVEHEKVLDGAAGDSDDFFGNAVSIHQNYAVATAPGDEYWGAHSGGAIVYQRVGLSWSPVTRIADGDALEGDASGSSVYLNGRRILMGAEMDNVQDHENAGSVSIFEGNCGNETSSRAAQNVAEKVEKVVNLVEKSTISAYPNPFSAQMTVQLNLKKATIADISIFNLEGQNVGQIFKGNADTNQTFDWNAENLANGVYFIRAILSDEILTQKVVRQRSGN